MSVEFRTVYPGVYEKDEQELLEITQEYLSGDPEELGKKVRAQMREGKRGYGNMELNPGADMINTTLGTNDLLARAYSYNPVNPLYGDQEYSKQTKWGGHVAVPFTVDIGPSFPYIPKGTDIWVSNDDFTTGRGLDHEVTFYKPIFAGDTLHSVLTRQSCIDVTEPGGTTMRKFRVIGESDLFNRKGEKVMHGFYSAIETFKLFKDRTMAKEYDKPLVIAFNRHTNWDKLRKMHVYTAKDWDLIKEIWSKERIRGADTLYWEDVKIGDEPLWTCDGPVNEEDRWAGGYFVQKPTTVRDLMMKQKMATAGTPPGMQMGPPMELKSDNLGRYHISGGGMPAPAVANHPNARSSFMNTAGRNYATRMVTNWMGDDGFLHKMCWRLAFCWDDGRNVFPAEHDRPSYLLKVPHLKEQGKFMNTHGYVGDVGIAKGYVCEKYIQDGKHYVDLVCWCETIEGDIWAECYAVVELPARGK